MKPVVSVVIVNYHVQEELFACLASLYKSKKAPSFEIIIVDNDEKKTLSQSLKRRFPKAKYVPSPGNIGFGAGNNLGAKHAQGTYLFFLNPDTKVSPNTIEALVTEFKAHKDAGAIAPLLINAKGKLYPLQGSDKLTPWSAIFAYSFINKLFPNNPVSKRFWLKDWNKKEIKRVNAVPGTAFMIKKTVFERIGKFDTSFFLYFEEYDIAKRLEKQKLSLYMTPATKVFHAWGKSTSKSNADILHIFTHSRFLYFKKYYGIISALLVEGILRLRRHTLLFAGILLLGTWLRFFHIGDNFFFDGEIGDNLLDIKNYYLHHTIPLIGPPTSHPWLFFGPLYYWIYGPVLILSKFNPISYVYFGSVFAVVLIIANYITVKKLFSVNAAVISSFLIAVSPLFLFFARVSRFFSLVPLIVYPFLYILYNITVKKSRSFFLLGLCFGLMLNFHYTPLMLIPFVVTVFLYKKIKLGLTDLLKLLTGIALPLSPFLLYDGLHKFVMTTNLLLWIPYRILGFLGLYHKNTVTTKVIEENTLSVSNFFSDSFIHSTIPFIGYALLALLLIGAFTIMRKKSKEKNYPIIFLLLWGIWGLIAVFVHGNPPSHYFVPILPFPILVASILGNALWNKNAFGKVLVIGVLAGMMLMNVPFFFSKEWFYKYKTDYLSYARQQQAVKSIIINAHGKPFRLKRVGFNDQFDKDYAQNYIYLLWLYGNEPVNNAYTTYTIYVGNSKPPTHLLDNETIFYNSWNTAIIREDL